SGQDTEGRCGMAQSSRSLLLGFAVVAFVWLAAPAWALGPSAPPIVSFSAVWISTTTTAHEPGATNGVPQLFASVDVLIPGWGCAAQRPERDRSGARRGRAQDPLQGHQRSVCRDELFPQSHASGCG